MTMPRRWFERFLSFAWLALVLLTACGETSTSPSEPRSAALGALEAPPAFAQQAKLVTPGAGFSRGLGGVVAIDGDTALARVSNATTTFYYVYVHSGATWTPQQKLSIAGSAAVSATPSPR
jgi:hypothetical protein